VNNLVNGVSPGILGGWATVSGSDWAVSGASTITGQTVSNASTGTNTVTGNLSNGTMISGAGFGGLNANFTYWVVNSTGTTFQIANSSGGSANPNLLTGLNITTAAYNIPGNITALASYTPLSGGAIPTGNPWANVVDQHRRDDPAGFVPQHHQHFEVRQRRCRHPRPGHRRPGRQHPGS